MKWRLRAIFLLAGITCCLATTSADDSFLDRRISFPPENESYLYLDQLQVIAPVIGKKVIFPPGLIDYVSRAKLQRPSIFPIFGSENHKSTVRDYLNQSQGVVGLNWKYDAAQDAVVYDFAWRQPVSHSGKELVDQLGKLAPNPSNGKLDPWCVAFNELMSEPQNFQHDWKVRLEDGCYFWSSASSTFLGDSVFAHLLKDADGVEHLLVLNYHSPPMTPGPAPTIAYYLFTADGKWEDGGKFEAGTIFTPPTIKFEPEKNRVTIEILDHPLKFMTKNGAEIVNPDRPNATYDYFLTINHGKLTASLRKNGNPLTPADYTIGVTPLRHLGD